MGREKQTRGFRLLKIDPMWKVREMTESSRDDSRDLEGPSRSDMGRPGERC